MSGRPSASMPPDMGAASMFEGANIGTMQGGVFYNIQGNVALQVPVHQGQTLDDIIEEVVKALEKLAGVSAEFRKIHEDLVDKKTKNTGNSFKGKQQIQDWMNGKIRFLWIIGGPGTGKTYIASSFIQWSEELADESPQADVAVVYAYLRYTEKLTTWDIILDVIIQLVQSSHELPTVTALVRRLLDKHRRKRGKPSFDELVQLLKDIVKQFRCVRITFDGLDEMLKKIQYQLVEIFSDVEAQIVFTSRPCTLLQARLRELMGDAVTFVDFVAEDQDLDLFIKSSISQALSLSALLKRHGALARIIQAIKDKANGMFLHAALQVEMLQRCLSLHEVEQALQRFPEKIEDLYAETLKRINDGNSTLPRLLLLWLLHVRGNIAIDDLQYAAAVCPQTYKFEESRVVSEADLISACCGLVVIESTTRQARFIHFTAHEILMQLLSDLKPAPHEVIALTCLARLSNCGLQDSTLGTLGLLQAVFRQNPLLEYAYSNTNFHINKVIATNPDIRRAVGDFVRHCKSFPYHPNPRHQEDTSICSLMSPVHVASTLGLPWLVKALVIEGADINSRCGHPFDRGWTSLMIAAAEGHEEVIDAILEFPQADVNIVNEQDYTALHFVCFRGNVSIIRKLCARPGMDIARRGHNGVSAFSAAAESGNEAALRFFLELEGTDINEKTNRGDAPLLSAAFRGQLTIVKTLLSMPGIDVNTVNNFKMSPLLCAAMKGNDSILNTLLAVPGINTSQVNERGNTSLLLAASMGQTTTVKILLGAIAPGDVNHANAEGQTALELAALNGHGDIVQALLAVQGIDVNTADQYGMTPLLAAAWKGHAEIVKTLLAVPEVDSTKCNEHGFSPLSLAARSGHSGVIQVLLERVPSEHINQKNHAGYSPLALAAFNGHLDVVKALLAVPQTDLNLLDAEGRSPLAIACHAGHEAVVDTLLSFPGVDANLARKQGDTPLIAAARAGHVSVVKKLMQAPNVRINQANGSGQSPLALAAWNGHDAVVDALLSGIEGKERCAGTMAARYAAYQGHLSILKAILSLSQVDLTHKTQRGSTILLHSLSYHRKTLHMGQSHREDHDPQPTALFLLDLEKVQDVAHIPADNGWTPLMMAAKFGYLDVVERLLLIPGGDVDATNKDGQTALQLATEGGHSSVVERLTIYAGSG